MKSLHFELKHDVEALEYVERARSRALLDLLERTDLRALPQDDVGEPLRFQELMGLLG